MNIHELIGQIGSLEDCSNAGGHCVALNVTMVAPTSKQCSPPCTARVRQQTKTERSLHGNTVNHAAPHRVSRQTACAPTGGTTVHSQTPQASSNVSNRCI